VKSKNLFFFSSFLRELGFGVPNSQGKLADWLSEPVRFYFSLLFHNVFMAAFSIIPLYGRIEQ
jgi:hypothetical protein